MVAQVVRSRPPFLLSCREKSTEITKSNNLEFFIWCIGSVAAASVCLYVCGGRRTCTPRQESVLSFHLSKGMVPLTVSALLYIPDKLTFDPSGNSPVSASHFTEGMLGLQMHALGSGGI